MTRADAPGATYLGERRCRFEVWAPRAEHVEILWTRKGRAPARLNPRSGGSHAAVLEDVAPGDRYLIRINGKDLPDPASRYQPEGVHGPSEVVDPAFSWQDSAWTGLGTGDCVFYELHVGTFTRAGTFDAMHAQLPRLRDLGVTALELMPVAQFPGERNWGYDGVGLYAVQNSYGGPLGLKRLVDACHREGIAVILDVVYNHLGPEGNYLGEFGPYFTDVVKTPWGPATNFSGRDSDEVRRFFIENALRWIDEFHIDGLRLDAVHAFHDPTARSFLVELNEAVHERAAGLGRRVLMIAESNQNDPRTVRQAIDHGAGCDAQWVDDFHHALHVSLTGERHGYYTDFDGLAALERSYRDAFVFTGQYSKYRGRRHGKRPWDIPFDRFVVCAQNHDQIGNRLLGERLSTLIDFESLKLAAGAVLLSPFIPMLFMGEEYGDPAPFLYFVSHSDAALVQAVREGRAREFASFQWQCQPPDPQSTETFGQSRLNVSLREREPHRTLERFHKQLLTLRRSHRSLGRPSRRDLEVGVPPDSRAIWLRRRDYAEETLTLFNFDVQMVSVSVPTHSGAYRRLLDSAAPEWRGPGESVPAVLAPNASAAVSLAPRSVAVFERVREGHQ